MLLLPANCVPRPRGWRRAFRLAKLQYRYDYLGSDWKLLPAWEIEYCDYEFANAPELMKFYIKGFDEYLNYLIELQSGDVHFGSWWAEDPWPTIEQVDNLRLMPF